MAAGPTRDPCVRRTVEQLLALVRERKRSSWNAESRRWRRSGAMSRMPPVPTTASAIAHLVIDNYRALVKKTRC